MVKLPSKATVLTGLGVFGVIFTSVLTAKAVNKADKLLTKAECIKGEALTKKETFLAAAPAYIPAVIAGGATIACILGANVLNKKSQAQLASAYALLESSMREYRNKVEVLYGENADEQVVEEVAKDKRKEFKGELPEGEALFFDFETCSYFTARFEDVLSKTITDDGLEVYIVSTPYTGCPDWVSDNF